MFEEIEFNLSDKIFNGFFGEFYCDAEEIKEFIRLLIGKARSECNGDLRCYCDQKRVIELDEVIKLAGDKLI